VARRTLLRLLPGFTARLLQGLLVVFAAATLAFICIELAPGDQATALGEQVPLAIRERVRALRGLNDPLPVQYLRWMRDLVRGDLGWSTAQQRPALPVLLEASTNSLILVVPAFVLSLALGMLLGAWQAVYAGSRRDRWSGWLTLAVYSVPEFWLAFLLIMLGHRGLGLPAVGMIDDMHTYMLPWDRVIDRLRHLVLPVTTIALVASASSRGISAAVCTMYCNNPLFAPRSREACRHGVCTGSHGAPPCCRCLPWPALYCPHLWPVWSSSSRFSSGPVSDTPCSWRSRHATRMS
jgi:ABC-type dipeptide/oligopeptide/nickel transport system permease component